MSTPRPAVVAYVLVTICLLAVGSLKVRGTERPAVSHPFSVPFAAAIPKVDVVIELDRLKYQRLEPVQGRIIVTVTGMPPEAASEAHEATVYLYGGKSNAGLSQAFDPKTGAVIQTPGDKLPNKSEAQQQAFFDRAYKLLLNNPRLALREFGLQLKGNGRYVIPLDANGTVVPVELGGSPVITSGTFYLGVLVVCDEEDRDTFYGFGDATMDVVPLLPRLNVRQIALDPASPPPVEQRPFIVTTRYEIEGLPTDDTQRVNVRQELAVRSSNVKPPHADSHAITAAVAGSPSGRGSFERRWEIVVPRAGTYDITLDVMAPGFLQSAGGGAGAARSFVVTVGPASGAPPPAKPAPAGPVWELSHVVGDQDKLEGRDLGNGTATGLSPSGFTANWNRVRKNSGGYAPDSLMTITLSGSPPERLRQGDRFQLSLSGTAAKQGPDPFDGRQPGEQASANISGSSHVKITASPHSSGISFPAGEDGTAIAVGGYFGKWWASDSRTLTVEVTSADSTGNLEIAFSWPGRGTIVRWVYRRASTFPSPDDMTAPVVMPKIAPLDTYADLEARLEPSMVEVSPRSGISTLVTVMIKGDRPNWKPVEVDYETVDAFGALKACKYLKIEGKGSRLTADMWKTNDGYFHWNLNVLANLGIRGGSYQVPITIRQAGHGDLLRLLTVRVAPARRATAPVAAAPPPAPGAAAPQPIRPTAPRPPAAAAQPPATAATDPEIETLRDAVRRNPNNPMTHTDLGLMLLRRGRVAEARESLFKALNLSPTNEYYMANFAEALLAAGERDQARSWASKAKALGLTQHRVFDLLGMK